MVQQILVVVVGDLAGDDKLVRLLTERGDVDVAMLQDDGTAVFARPPETDGHQLMLSAGDRRWTLPSADVAAGRVELNTLHLRGDQLLEPPPTFSYEGNVRPSDVESRPGRIGLLPRSSVPPNRVLDRDTARYFDVAEADLHARDLDWVLGHSIEYEISREPVGWALDEWLGTDALAPYEDSAVSSSTVEMVANVGQLESLKEQLGTESSEDGRTVADESRASNLTARVKSRGFDAGLGRNQSSSSGLTIDPVIALAEAVTGTLQLGFNSSQATSSSQENISLQRGIVQRIERSTRQSQVASADAASKSSSSLRDDWSLRAVRNLAQGTTTNLARFSVCHQWRVATVVTDYRPVIFVPIDRVSEPFSRADVFVHRSVLEATVLDDTLRPSLHSAADRYTPGPLTARIPGSPSSIETDDREVRTVSGLVTFTDAARGRGSLVRFAVTFREGSGDSGRPFTTDLVDTTPGEPREFQVEVNRPLSHYVGTDILFVNPAIVSDGLAAIGSIEITAIMANAGDRVQLHKLTNVELLANEARFFRPSTPSAAHVDEHEDLRLAADEARLLSHLDHNRAYYRLAIDLQTDSVSRFYRLKERLRRMGSQQSSTSPEMMPLDCRPLGVVGGHLAFAADSTKHLVSPDQKAVKGVGKPAQLFLASTSTGGVFVEALRGSYEVSDVAPMGPPQLPAGPKDQNVTYPWPQRATPSSATIQKVLTQGDAKEQTGGAPGVPGSETGKATEVPTQTTTAQVEAAKKAKEKADSAGKAATPPAAAGDRTDDGTPDETDAAEADAGEER